MVCGLTILYWNLEKLGTRAKKGSAVSQDLGKAFNTICLNLLLQKPKSYKVLGSLLDVNHVYVYWQLKNESK